MFKSKKGATEVFPMLPMLIIAVVVIVIATVIGINSINKNKDDTENVIQDAENVASDLTDKIDGANRLSAMDMTKAIDRFVSEYDFFVSQSANIKDFSEHRMGNLIGVKTKEDLTKIEVNTNSDTSNDFRINKNTKYPVNVATAKKIISFYTNNDNFTEINGSCYYYAPEFGVVVLSRDGSVAELNKLLRNEKNLSENTVWLKLS